MHVNRLYDDVVAAFRKWKAPERVAHPLRIAIYSSGSEMAQRDLIAHTNHGDLSSVQLRYYFYSIVSIQTAHVDNIAREFPLLMYCCRCTFYSKSKKPYG